MFFSSVVSKSDYLPQSVTSRSQTSKNQRKLNPKEVKETDSKVQRSVQASGEENLVTTIFEFAPDSKMGDTCKDYREYCKPIKDKYKNTANEIADKVLPNLHRTRKKNLSKLVSDFDYNPDDTRKLVLGKLSPAKDPKRLFDVEHVESSRFIKKGLLSKNSNPEKIPDFAFYGFERKITKPYVFSYDVITHSETSVHLPKNEIQKNKSERLKNNNNKKELVVELAHKVITKKIKEQLKNI